MLRSRIAALVAAGTLAVGGGVALAETAPEDGTLGETVDETVDDTVVDDDSTTDDTATDDTATTDDSTTDDSTTDDEVGTEDVEGLDEAEVEDDEVDVEADVEVMDHGALVSEAAQNHDHDEDCGNHGAWVSHWARFGEAPECAAAAEEEVAVTEDGTDDDAGDDEVAAVSAGSGTASKPGKGNAKHGR